MMQRSLPSRFAEAFTVDLPMPPSLWGLYRGQGKQRGKSATYHKWCREAGWIVVTERGDFKNVDGPVRISLRLVRPRTPSDLDNRFKPCLDVLTATQTIRDDSQVVAMEACWVDSGPPCTMTVTSVEAERGRDVSTEGHRMIGSGGHRP